jgi:DNA transposition AAA+ family ATPase
MMPRHFLALQGAQTVKTNALKLTRRAVADLLAVETGAMGVVHGDAGLGKTFAVEEAVADWPDVKSYWVAFPGRPTMRLVAATLLSLLTGEPSEGDRFRATAVLMAELARRQDVLVIVDEAQRLNQECIEYLRHLHDHPTTRFTLLLVGGNGCWEVLSREPMLRSRIFRRVTFRPLPSREVAAVLPTYHRLYRDATEELLLFIDDNFAHGNFRNWASFTRSAADLLGRRRRHGLDEAVARNVFALYGGGADAC